MTFSDGLDIYLGNGDHLNQYVLPSRKLTCAWFGKGKTFIHITSCLCSMFVFGDVTLRNTWVDIIHNHFCAKKVGCLRKKIWCFPSLLRKMVNWWVRLMIFELFFLAQSLSQGTFPKLANHEATSPLGDSGRFIVEFYTRYTPDQL